MWKNFIEVSVDAQVIFFGGATWVDVTTVEHVLATGHVTGSGSSHRRYSNFDAGTIANGYDATRDDGLGGRSESQWLTGRRDLELQNGIRTANFASGLRAVSSGQCPQPKALL